MSGIETPTPLDNVEAPTHVGQTSQTDVGLTPLTRFGQTLDGERDKAQYLSGSEATAQLQELQVTLAKAEALKAALVGQINKSEIWRADDPNGTANSYLRRELNFDQRTAQRELRTAGALTEFPQLDQALQQGEVSRQAIDLILSVALRTQQRKDQLPDFIELLIECARAANLTQLRRLLSAWADQVDPETTFKDESDARSRRYFHMGEFSDGFRIEGFFDISDGMKIKAAINASSTSLCMDTHRKGQLIESPGETVAPELDPTTMNAQQRADAFIKMIIEPALNGKVLPTSGGFTPNVVITLSLDQLEGHESSHAKTNEAMANGDLQQLELGSAFIETTNGPGRGILSIKSALRLSCDANVQQIVLDPASVPLDIGRTTRVIPPHIRRTLAIRDGGCKFPYCDRPVAWCEAHHIQHWARGGPTSLDNLVLLCSRHHHAVHSAGHEITIDALGRPQIRLRHEMLRE